MQLQTGQTNFKKRDNQISYNKKIVIPTAEELKEHDEYLRNNLKKNYFS